MALTPRDCCHLAKIRQRRLAAIRLPIGALKKAADRNAQQEDDEQGDPNLNPRRHAHRSGLRELELDLARSARGGLRHQEVKYQRDKQRQKHIEGHLVHPNHAQPARRTQAMASQVPGSCQRAANLPH